MDYFEEEEKKQKEALEEKKYQELYAKQARISKIIMLACFIPIGSIFTLLGILLSLVLEKDEAFDGITFIVLGVIFIILGIILYLVMPKKGDYKKFKSRVQKFGGINTYSMAIQIGLLEERVKELEEDIKELKTRNK